MQEADSEELDEEDRMEAMERRARVCMNCGETNGPGDDSDWSEEHCFFCFSSSLKPKYRCAPARGPRQCPPVSVLLPPSLSLEHALISGMGMRA